MSGVRRAGDTHRPLGLEAFPGATAKNRWMGEATAGHEQGWTAPAPVPGMISLMADPGENTLLQQGGAPEGAHGALMMRIAVGEEGLGEDDEEVEEDGGTNHPSTLNMNLDRKQERATA